MAQQDESPIAASGRGLPSELQWGEEALRAVLSAHTREFEVGGQPVSIEERWLYFPEYAGRSPDETMGRPIVGPPDRPFPQLQVVKRMEDEGCAAGWMYRKGHLISAWDPLVDAIFPTSVRALLARIEARAGNAKCWHVVAWQRQLRFVHLVRGSSETIPQARLRWLEAALAEGVPASAFEVWRWFGGTLKGRVLRLTSYFLDRLEGWAECRDGKLIYSAEGMCGEDGRCDMIEHYRGWGARTEADLLWVVFVRNCQGMSWCGIEEWDAASEGPQLALNL